MELKNTITILKNWLEGFDIRLNQAEVKITELKEKSSHSRTKKKKEWNRVSKA